MKERLAMMADVIEIQILSRFLRLLGDKWSRLVSPSGKLNLPPHLLLPGSATISDSQPPKYKLFRSTFFHSTLDDTSPAWWMVLVLLRPRFMGGVARSDFSLSPPPSLSPAAFLSRFIAQPISRNLRQTRIITPQTV